MTTSMKRVELYKELPLDTPFSLHVFPAYYCNFKCSYCLHSLSEEQLKELSFKRQLMDIETYKKAIDSLKEFPGRLKALIFAGHGEPLIHKDIDKMVAYAKENNVAERIEIVTNASLLTRELSDKLIAAGLDRLRISIQGMTSQKYRDVSGVEIDYNNFLENIRYFYNNKENTNVYIKIIDIALENSKEEQRFHDTFSPISDTVAIEYTIPFVPEIDHSRFNTDFTKCKQGHKRSSNICSMPFYMLVLEPNGNVVPCCSTSVPMIYGNIHETGLKEVWNSEKLRSFLRMQLTDRNINAVCRHCSVPSFGLQEGDYLDEYAAELLKFYK
jgi:radical SAM protein with 4Fe4S-binding SPASM domain